MFIAVEGVECSGKSTLIQAIQQYGQDNHIDMCLTREPGGTLIAEEIRSILLSSKNQEVLHADTELLLMFASRVQHIHTVIKPALDRGQWVISDRFVDASYAYQGGGRSIGFAVIDQLVEQFIPHNLYPNYVLFMNAPLDVCLQRMYQRGQLDRIEQESVDFFERVYHAYQKRQTQEAERFIELDATLDQRELTKQIGDILCQITQTQGTPG
ncbi:MAG: dTMP kinase [Legionellales bacterium]|nr:dTMP kinase [Legionellales bacterium]|tara:strand:- start:2922 stop:3557 length:636 start_codon:yes stop_codon:yes gene_type:complete